MGRPASKADLINTATTNYEKLNALIADLTKKELSTSFDFSGDEKKKESHWKRDKNLRDIIIHLFLMKNCFQKVFINGSVGAH